MNRYFRPSKLGIKASLLLACACLANAPAVFPQSSLQWSDSIVVATETAYITAPRVALLTDGTPIVVWGVSSNPNKIWLSRLQNGAFSNPLSVLESPYLPSLFGFAGFDVAVSGDQVFMTFERLQSGIFMTHSGDGGLSFDTPELVEGNPAGGYVTLSSIAVDGIGNPMVSYIRDKNGSKYQFRRSTDGGLSFLPPVEASAPAAGGAVCDCCTSDMLVSGDTVWLVFRNNNNNLRDIWVTRSTDAGATFDIATDMDDTDWTINVCPISGPQMAQMGDSILTVWKSGAGGGSRVYGSSLHGGTMEQGWQFDFSTSDTVVTIQNQPDIAAQGDTVGVVFQENGREIVFAFSATGAKGLNDQYYRFSLPEHFLQFPTVVFRDGVFHLVYVDATSGQVLYRQGTVMPTVAAKEPMADLVEVSVFPNPVSGNFFWIQSKSSDLLEWALFDVFGKKYLTQKAGGYDAKIEMTGLTKGIYFLKIMTTKGEVVRKLIRN